MVAFSAIAEAPPFLTRRNPPEKKASPDKVASVPGANKNYREMKKNMVNILELYTLHRYSIVDDIKREMIDLLGEESLVLMTGSGPTVYGLTQNHKAAKIVFERMKDRYPESFVSGTLSYI